MIPDSTGHVSFHAKFQFIYLQTAFINNFFSNRYIVSA